MKHIPSSIRTAGFTLIEMLVIAPIVILAIGAFLTVIISMTGEVLASRGANTLAYNVQDAMNRIEQDVKLSTTFLATNNVALCATACAPTEVRGFNNDNTKFTNYSFGTSGKSLILNMLVTSGNPLSASSGVVYLADKPSACGSTEMQSNTPLTMNVIYFVKDNTLWRRTIMPPTYYSTDPGLLCGTPWQQPSCAPGTVNALCKTNDEKLVEGVATNTGFTIDYFTSASATTSNSQAVSNTTDSLRNIALASTPTANVTINATQTVAGRDISRSATLRATRLDTNASTIAVLAPDTVPSKPVITGKTLPGNISQFSWPYPSGGNVRYTADFSLDGGTTWTNVFTKSTDRTFTLPSYARLQTIDVRVIASNGASVNGSAGTTGTAKVTIPPWNNLEYVNNWSSYSATYADGAYTKTNDGMIVLKGLVKRTGTLTAGETIATLPEGFRPASNMAFLAGTSTNLTATIYVNATGAISASTNSDEGWVSFSNIKFLPADTPYTWNPMALANTWTNRGAAGDPAPPAIAFDSIGRVHVRGHLSPGTTTDNAVITPLTGALSPASSGQYHYIATRSGSGGFNAVGINAASNALVAKGIAVGTAIFTNFNYIPSTKPGWITPSPSPAADRLQNSWVTYGGVYTSIQYMKTSDDVVNLKGMVKNGTTTANTVILNLPEGMRPKERILHYTVCGGNDPCRVDVLPNGNIITGAGVNTWISLDNLSFIGEQ